MIAIVCIYSRVRERKKRNPQTRARHPFYDNPPPTHLHRHNTSLLPPAQGAAPAHHARIHPSAASDNKARRTPANTSSEAQKQAPMAGPSSMAKSPLCPPALLQVCGGGAWLNYGLLFCTVQYRVYPSTRASGVYPWSGNGARHYSIIRYVHTRIQEYKRSGPTAC